MKDLISIVVPVYNIAEYLPRSLNSISQQTYENLEIIAVDDGSEDESAKVLQELQKKDPRIRIIHQANGGVSKARFAGINAARGEWIGFVDGDDYIEPDMYERLLKNAYKYNAEISHCGYQMVFPSRVDFYYNTGRLILQDQETGIKDLLEGTYMEPGLWNKLFHRTVFHSLLSDGVMDFSIKNTEDLLMNYYLFREAKQSVYEDFCPYHYILRKGSAATAGANEQKLRDPLTVLYRLKQETEGNPVFQRAINRSIASRLTGIIGLPLKGNNEWIVPYRDQARKELRKLLPEVIKEKNGLKMKLKAVGAAVCPAAYRVIHSVYSTARGTKNKYEVK